MHPRISVIMPVWNVEPYLRECMDSILDQTMGDLEFICIDDASDDGSPQILKEYAERDTRVKLLHTEHVGAYRARKAGVDVACGEFVYFMDSDDVLDTNAFKELLEDVDREHLDQIIFSAEVFSDEEDEESFKERRKRFEAYYAIPDAFCGKVMSGPDLMYELERDGHFFVSPPFRLTKLAPFKEREYPFPHGAPFHADEFFTPVSLYFSDRAMIVNRRYYRRRVRPGSISTVLHKEKVHVSSLLNVIFHLCMFKPLQDDMVLRRADIAANMVKLVRAVMRRGAGLDVETMTGLISDLRVPLAPEVKMFLAACFVPLMFELQRSEARNERKLASRDAEIAKLRTELAAALRDGVSARREIADEMALEVASANAEAKRLADAAARLRRESQEVAGSESYRTGMAVTWPLRWLYRLISPKGGK